MMWDRLGHRRSTRYPVALPCRYQPQGCPPVQTAAGRTCSLSDRGACLELAETFPPATRLRLTLEAATGCIGLEAEVVWVGEPNTSGGGLLHGVSFLQVTPALERTIQSLLGTPTHKDPPPGSDALDFPRATAKVMSSVERLP